MSCSARFLSFGIWQSACVGHYRPDHHFYEQGRGEVGHLYEWMADSKFSCKVDLQRAEAWCDVLWPILAAVPVCHATTCRHIAHQALMRTPTEHEHAVALQALRVPDSNNELSRTHFSETTLTSMICARWSLRWTTTAFWPRKLSSIYTCIRNYSPSW